MGGMQTMTNENERQSPSMAAVSHCCKWCGVVLQKKGTRGRHPEFCNDSHRHQHYRANSTEPPTFNKVCIECGDTFKSPNTGRKLCSEECRTRYYDRIKTRICPTCGTTFVKRHGAQRFCTPKCGKESALKTLTTKRRWCVCQNPGCGQRYWPKQADRVKYCSKACADEHKRTPERLAITARRRQDKLAVVAIEREKRAGRECRICGSPFRSSSGERYCSDACRKERDRRKTRERAVAAFTAKPRICRECETVFVPEYGDMNRTYCSDNCARRHLRRIGKAKRRARIKGRAYETINPMAVFRRDGWKCQQCGTSTPREARGTTQDNAPELDHIIPLAGGGTHTWNNVQCLCRRCNQEKGDKTQPTHREGLP